MEKKTPRNYIELEFFTEEQEAAIALFEAEERRRQQWQAMSPADKARALARTRELAEKITALAECEDDNATLEDVKVITSLSGETQLKVVKKSVH